MWGKRVEDVYFDHPDDPRLYKPEVEEKITIDDLLKGPVRSKGPKGDRIWDFSQKRGEVIPFPKKPKRGIEELIEKEDIFVGKAPKTKKSTLDAKKERDLLLRDADEDILRIKKENKDAIARFKEKMRKDEPDKFYAGGIAPLVGEPSYSADFYDDRIPYAGGLLVKGGKWFLNNLRRALKDIESNQGFKNLTPERKEGLTSEIKNLIKRIEGGGPIPDEMIQTIRHDPKFAEISKTRSTDPDLYEFEDVILNYGKDRQAGKQAQEIVDEVFGKGHPANQQIDLLEKFDVTGKTKHAEGGRIEMGAGGIIKLLKGFLKKKPKPKSNKLSEQDVVALKKKHGLDPESLKKDDEAFKLRLQQILAKHSTKHAYGGRVSYAGGGQAGLPAITQGIETPQTNMQGPQMPAPAPQPAGISGANFGQNQMDMYQQQMNQNPWQQQMKQGIGGMQKPQYKGQFRMPFGLGGMSRRAFLKMLGLGAALPFMPKALTKLAPKAVPKVVETVASSNASGMPLWFPKLVERVIKEGDDVTRKAGSEAMERQTVHSARTPEGTPIEVTQDLTTGDTIVDIGEQTKHGWSAGRYGQPVRLELKKGEWIEPTKGKKGVKTNDEFLVEEAEFTGGHPENVKFEETVDFKYGDHASDFTEVEKYAVGKNTDKKIIGKQAYLDDSAEATAQSRADYESEFASGGIARLLGE